MHPFFRSRPSGKARIGKKGQTRPRSRVPRLERLEERLAPASADLSVMQTASNAVAGGNVTYTLTVQNLGPDPATGVTLTDSLPTETMYMSSTTTQGTITPPTTGGQGTLQGDLFFTIYSGTPNVLKRSFTYNGTTLTFNSGNVNVAASDGADGATFAPNGQLIVGGQNKNAVNEVNVNTGVVTTKTAGGGPAYHVALDPNGTRAWTTGQPGDLVSVPLSPFANGTDHKVTGNDAGVSDLAFSPNGTVYYTNGGTQGNGNVGTIDLTTFKTTRHMSGVIAAHGMTFDPFTGDLMLFGGTHVTQVNPATFQVVSDLSVSGANFDNGTVDGAGHLFVASNKGSMLFIDYSHTGQINNAANYQTYQFVANSLDDVVPAAGLGAQPQTLVANLGNLAVNATTTVTITVAVNPGANGSLINTVSVVGNETDNNQSNNTSTLTITAGTQADLAVSVMAGNATPIENSPQTYTVTVTNLGPSLATGVQLQNTLPAGFSLANATPAAGTVFDSATGQWTIGSLGVNATLTLVLNGSVNSGTFGSSLVETAAVSASDQLDPNSTNNAATSTITVRQGVLVVQPVPTQTAGTAFSYTATVEDPAGNVVPGFVGTVHFTSNDPNANLMTSYTFTSTDMGVHTFPATLFLAGPDTITGSGPAGGPIPVPVVPAAASKLVFGQEPGSAVAGQALSPAVTVVVEDPYNNIETGDGSLVTISIGVNAGGSTLGGTLSRSASGGVATFPDLTLNKVGTGYTLAAIDGTLTGAASTAFTVNPAAASQMVFQSEPASAVAGQSLGAITILLEDPFGNRATGDASVVTVFPGNNPGGSTISGTRNVQVSGGSVTFGNLSLNKVGTGYTLVFVDGALPGITSTPFAIAPAAASQLQIGGLATSTTAGVAQGYTVTALDPFGNVATSFLGTVHFSSSDARASLQPDYPFVAGDQGSHAFSATLVTAGAQTLTVTGPGSLQGSAPITVVAAAASHLGLTAPSVAYAEATFAVTVLALDPYGNVAPSYTGSVRFSSTDTGTATVLPATYTFVASDQGQHVFANLLLTTVGTQTLTVTDTVRPTFTITSGPITVSHQDDNALFLAGLYHDLLGRAADSAGLAFFQPPLDSARAAALDQVALQILGSGEYKSDLAEAFLARFLPADKTNPAYINLFANELAGMTDEAVIAQMVGSGEYFQDQGGTNLAWLQAIYPALLGRPLDTSGQGYFLGLLNGGTTTAAVASQILASQEYRTDLVQGYYTKYLGHAAPAGGVSYWLGQFQAGQTDEQVIAGFCSSTEYLQLNGNGNDSWLASIYPALLNRPLDASGASYFGNLLYSGYAAQRQATVAQFLASQEYEADLVNGYYQKYLGHPVSSADLNNYWYVQFKSGQTYEQIQSQILGSGEYFARNGSDNLTWLQSVYVQVLNRPLDQAGLSYFGGLLGGGTPRQQAALLILQSAEYQADLVQSVYQTYLGRAASASDVSYWQGQLQSGLTTAAFIENVLVSVEYFRRSHPYP